MQRQLELFREHLPYRPWATDYLGPMSRHDRDEAMQMRYIQPNPHVLTWWLLFDIDRPGAAHDWQLRELPPPNFTVENPANGHCHVFYRLDCAVYKADPAHYSKAIYFLAVIEAALRKALEADRSYPQLLAKTPAHPSWRTIEWRQDGYDLYELADYLELERVDRRRSVEPIGTGRNVCLFDTVRRWAYRAVKWHWDGTLDAFHDSVLMHCATENTKFPAPLPYQEFKHIAKSIANWVWYRFSPEQFSAIQRARQLKANPAHNARATATRTRIEEYLRQHPEASNRAIARAIGVSHQTVNNHMQAEKGSKAKPQEGDTDMDKLPLAREDR